MTAICRRTLVSSCPPGRASQSVTRASNRGLWGAPQGVLVFSLFLVVLSAQVATTSVTVHVRCCLRWFVPRALTAFECSRGRDVWAWLWPPSFLVWRRQRQLVLPVCVYG